MEIKKEEMLPEDVVNRRIAPMAPYDVNLDPTIRDVTTSRTFTSKQWGGNTQSTFPSIRQDMLARHGLNDLCISTYSLTHIRLSDLGRQVYFLTPVWIG